MLRIDHGLQTVRALAEQFQLFDEDRLDLELLFSDPPIAPPPIQEVIVVGMSSINPGSFNP